MSDDYIKREDAIEIIRNSPFKRHTTEICYFVGKLKSVPSADVRENVRGEWIEQEDDYYHYWECSECGFGVGLDDIRNYCPHCGADMRGEA